MLRYRYMFLIFLIASLPLLAFAGGNPTAVANSIGNKFLSKYGSTDGLIQYAVNPLLSSTKMTTINGKISFNAQIECPNAYPFLQILFQPTTTNDFYALISQAIDGSTHFNYQIQTPLISGVCNKGFISCGQGTWNNCHFFKWVINSNGSVSYQEIASTTQLGTCFCVNNSCGGNIFQQFSQIASTFGMGLATAIAKQENFAISDIRSNFPTLTYYGQSADRCSTGGSVATLKGYYNNSPAISNAKVSTANFELQNENSAYYSLVNSEYMKDNPVSLYSCSIKKKVDFPPASDCPSDVINVSFGHSGDNSLGGGVYWWQKRIYVDDPACVRKIEVPYVEWDDSIKLYVNDTVVWQNWPYCGERDANFTSHPGLVAYGESLIKAFKHGDNYLKIQLCVGGYGECWTNWRIYLGPYYKIRLLTDNDCSSYENNSKCKLKEEEVCDKNGNNCVYTVKDFNSTGVSASLLKKCYSYTQGETGQKWLVCADGDKFEYETNTISNTLPNKGVLETGSKEWWYIKRTYQCQAGDLTIPSPEREENIINNGSLDTSTGVLTYPDKTQEVHGIGGYDGTFQASYKPGFYDNCQYTCVVESDTDRTSVLSGGASSISATSPSGHTQEKRFLVCKKNAYGQWYCPATGNERIIQPCTCLDMGARSIAVWSAVKSAAHDLTCSSE